MTSTTITEAEFDERFKPRWEDDSEGSYKQHWPHSAADIAELEEARLSNRLWTVLDCDGEFAIAQGYHHVNRQYYVICDVAHGDDEVIEVECWNPERCIRCGAFVDAPGSKLENSRCFMCKDDSDEDLGIDPPCEACGRYDVECECEADPDEDNS